MGRYKNGYGEILILKPEHPSPKEVVHHINGIRDDNRIENLQLLPSLSEHIKIHRPYYNYPKGIHYSPKTEFKKGHPPFHTTPVSTSFKKGHPYYPRHK